jgi:hypothetical protein
MADPQTGKQVQDKHPGMFGDGTEEQNLNQKGDPSARISEADVKAAFKDKPAEKAKD